MSFKNIKDQNKKTYDEISTYWEDGWEEKDKQLNFSLLFKLADFCNKSLSKSFILDAGCGTGDMVRYLPKTTKYIGIDIYKPALKRAKIKYPKYTFKYADLLTFKNPVLFDYIFLSGALTVNLKSININNYLFLEKALLNLWTQTGLGLAFNILTDEKYKINDTDLFHYNIRKVQEIIEKITMRYIVRYTPLDSENDQHTIYMIR